MISRIKNILERFFFQKLGSNYRIWTLKRWGVKIGKDCYIDNASFSTEPYLIEIGDHVAISSRCSLVTHDGGVWIFLDEYPKMDLFGKIKIGNNTFLGTEAVILPNTTIGNNCLIGAGAVVRGNIPDNSVVIGNPGKVIMNVKSFKILVKNNPMKLYTKGLSPRQKKKIIQELDMKMQQT
ncbi:MAG: acyltransferase [Bacteroidales bacterium]|nr:acyltransferase [Bacteroidales bacterium]